MIRKWIKGFGEAVQQNNLQYLKDNIIREDKSYTIGSGKDFETIDDAFVWLNSIIQTSGTITFRLDEGVHVMNATNFIDGHIIRNKNIEIIGSDYWNSRTNYTITTNGDFDDMFGMYMHTYLQAHNCKISFKGFVVNPTLNGATYMIQPSFIKAYDNSIINFTFVDTINISSSFLAEYSRVFIKDNSSLMGGNGLERDAYLHVMQTSHIGSITGFGVKRVHFHSLATVTYDSLPFPINEIQYDGSYIADGKSALSFKV